MNKVHRDTKYHAIFFLKHNENFKERFSGHGSHRIKEIMMRLVLLNDYFRAQIIYTSFRRRLAKKELPQLFQRMRDTRAQYEANHA